MRDTNESTNSRVLYFSIFSMCCLLGLATWQVLYLRKYFKSKKLIEWTPQRLQVGLQTILCVSVISVHCVSSQKLHSHSGYSIFSLTEMSVFKSHIYNAKPLLWFNSFRKCYFQIHSSHMRKSHSFLSFQCVWLNYDNELLEYVM